MTALEDQLYIALMAAKQTLQPLVRNDVRQQSTMLHVESAIKAYNVSRSPPPGPIVQKMDWDAVKDIG